MASRRAGRLRIYRHCRRCQFPIRRKLSCVHTEMHLFISGWRAQTFCAANTKTKSFWSPVIPSSQPMRPPRFFQVWRRSLRQSEQFHPLTGAATIVSGVGAAAQTDTFEQQSGEIIASAIQTARENQANQIEGNLKNLGTGDYSIYRAQRDVIDYHSMCSLETALAQVKSSLKATSPNQGNLPPAAQGGLTPVPPTMIQPPTVVPPSAPPAPAPPAPAPPPPPLPSPSRIRQACETAAGDLRKHGLTTCGDFIVIAGLLVV